MGRPKLFRKNRIQIDKKKATSPVTDSVAPQTSQVDVLEGFEPLAPLVSVPENYSTPKLVRPTTTSTAAFLAADASTGSHRWPQPTGSGSRDVVDQYASGIPPSPGAIALTVPEISVCLHPDAVPHSGGSAEETSRTGYSVSGSGSSQLSPPRLGRPSVSSAPGWPGAPEGRNISLTTVSRSPNPKQNSPRSHKPGEVRRRKSIWFAGDPSRHDQVISQRSAAEGSVGARSLEPCELEVTPDARSGDTSPGQAGSTASSQFRPRRISKYSTLPSHANARRTLTPFDRLLPNFVAKHVRNHVDQLVSAHDEEITKKLLRDDALADPEDLLPKMTPAVIDDFAVVVMADVSGYSKLCAELADRGIEGTELLAAIMKGLMDKIIQVISVNGGDIIKFVGDAVIFCWRLSAKKTASNALRKPTTPGTHRESQSEKLTSLKNSEIYGEHTAPERAELVVKACECCLDLLEKLKDYRVGIPRKRDSLGASSTEKAQSSHNDVARHETRILHLHLGIGAGPVFDVHVGGVHGRWEHFIVGEAMQQIAKVLDLAKPGELAISQSAFSLFKQRIDIKRGRVQTASYTKDCVILSSFDRTAVIHARHNEGNSSSQEYAALWDIERTPFDVYNSAVSQILQERLREHGLPTGYMRNLDLYKQYINHSALYKLDGDIKSSSPIELSQGVSHLLSMNELRQATTLFIKIGKKEGSFDQVTRIHKELLLLEKQITALHESGNSQGNPYQRQVVEGEDYDTLKKTRAEMRATGDHVMKKSLNRVQRVMTIVQKVLAECHGVLRQFHVDDKGAVLLVFFGLPPFANRNDAANGIKAARQIAHKFLKSKIKFSMGLSTGHVSIGGVGNSVRTEYALMGDSINMAARLMCLPIADCTVVCDEKTMKLTDRSFTFKPCGLVSVKGKSHPIEAYIPLHVSKLDGVVEIPISVTTSHKWQRQRQSFSIPAPVAGPAGTIRAHGTSHSIGLIKATGPASRRSSLSPQADADARGPIGGVANNTTQGFMALQRQLMIGREGVRKAMKGALEAHSIRGERMRLLVEGHAGQGISTLENLFKGMALTCGYIICQGRPLDTQREMHMSSFRQIVQDLLHIMTSETKRRIANQRSSFGHTGGLTGAASSGLSKSLSSTNVDLGRPLSRNSREHLDRPQGTMAAAGSPPFARPRGSMVTLSLPSLAPRGSGERVRQKNESTSNLERDTLDLSNTSWETLLGVLLFHTSSQDDVSASGSESSVGWHGSDSSTDCIANNQSGQCRPSLLRRKAPSDLLFRQLVKSLGIVSRVCHIRLRPDTAATLANLLLLHKDPNVHKVFEPRLKAWEQSSADYDGLWLRNVVDFIAGCFNHLASRNRVLILLSDGENCDDISWFLLEYLMQCCRSTAYAIFRKPATAHTRRGELVISHGDDCGVRFDRLNWALVTTSWQRIKDRHVTESVSLDGFHFDEVHQLIACEWNRLAGEGTTVLTSGTSPQRQLRFEVSARERGSNGMLDAFFVDLEQVNSVHWFIVERIQEVSDGNPHFIKSIVTSLWDRRQLLSIDSSGMLLLLPNPTEEDDRHTSRRLARRHSSGWAALRKYSVFGVSSRSKDHSMNGFSTCSSLIATSSTSMGPGSPNYTTFMEFEKALAPNVDIQTMVVSQLDKLDPWFLVLLKVSALMGFAFTLDELSYFFHKDNRADVNLALSSVKPDATISPIPAATAGDSRQKQGRSTFHRHSGTEYRSSDHLSRQAGDIGPILWHGDTAGLLEQLDIPSLMEIDSPYGVGENARMEARFCAGIKLADNRMAARRFHLQSALRRTRLMPIVTPSKTGIVFAFCNPFYWNSIKASMLTSQRRQLHKQLANFYEEILAETLKAFAAHHVASTDLEAFGRYMYQRFGSMASLRESMQQTTMAAIEHHWESEFCRITFNQSTRSLRFGLAFSNQSRTLFPHETLDISRILEDASSMARITSCRCPTLKVHAQRKTSIPDRFGRRVSQVLRRLVIPTKRGMNSSHVDVFGEDASPQATIVSRRKSSIGNGSLPFDSIRVLPIPHDHARFGRILYHLRQLTSLNMCRKDYHSAAVHGTLLLSMLENKCLNELPYGGRSAFPTMTPARFHRGRRESTLPGGFSRRAKSIPSTFSSLGGPSLVDSAAVDPNTALLVLDCHSWDQRDTTAAGSVDEVMHALSLLKANTRALHVAKLCAEVAFALLSVGMPSQACANISKALTCIGQPWPVPDGDLDQHTRRICQAFQTHWVLRKGKAGAQTERNTGRNNIVSIWKADKKHGLASPRDGGGLESQTTSPTEDLAIVGVTEGEHLFLIGIHEALIRLSFGKPCALEWQYLVLRTHLLLVHSPQEPLSSRLVSSFARVAHTLCARELPDQTVSKYLQEAWLLLRERCKSLPYTSQLSSRVAVFGIVKTPMEEVPAVKAPRRRGISFFSNRILLTRLAQKRSASFSGVHWPVIVQLSCCDEWFDAVVKLLYHQASINLIQGNALEALRLTVAMEEVVLSRQTSRGGAKYVAESLLFRAFCHYWLLQPLAMRRCTKKLWDMTKSRTASRGTLWALSLMYLQHSGFMLPSTTLASDSTPYSQNANFGSATVEKVRDCCDLIWGRLAEHVSKTFVQDTVENSTIDVVLYESLSLDWKLQTWRLESMDFILDKPGAKRITAVNFLNSLGTTMARLEKIGLLLESLQLDHRSASSVTCFVTLKALVLLAKMVPGLRLIGQTLRNKEVPLAGPYGPTYVPTPPKMSVASSAYLDVGWPSPVCSSLSARTQGPLEDLHDLNGLFDLLTRTACAVAEQIHEKTAAKVDKGSPWLQQQLNLVAKFVRTLYLGPDMQAVQDRLSELFCERLDSSWFRASISQSQLFKRKSMPESSFSLPNNTKVKGSFVSRDVSRDSVTGPCWESNPNNVPSSPSARVRTKSKPFPSQSSSQPGLQDQRGRANTFGHYRVPGALGSSTWEVRSGTQAADCQTQQAKPNVQIQLGAGGDASDKQGAPEEPSEQEMFDSCKRTRIAPLIEEFAKAWIRDVGQLRPLAQALNTG